MAYLVKHALAAVVNVILSRFVVQDDFEVSLVRVQLDTLLVPGCLGSGDDGDARDPRDGSVCPCCWVLLLGLLVVLIVVKLNGCVLDLRVVPQGFRPLLG